MRFGQKKKKNREIKREIVFFKNDAENGAVKLVPDLLLFLRNALYEVKVSGLQLSFNTFW